MLLVNTSHRLNINQCLNHSWFLKNLGNSEVIEMSPDKKKTGEKHPV
jgi:hypothetical protein